MSQITDWLSIASAIVSAVGGSFAARAAYLSARSARDAQHTADEVQHRTLGRELAFAANAVLVEDRRVSALVNEVLLVYRAMEALSGTSQNSSLAQYGDAAKSKRTEAGELAADAALFTDGARSLARVPAEEVDRVLLRQSVALARIQALRDDLARELATVEAQCAQLRDQRFESRVQG